MAVAPCSESFEFRRARADHREHHRELTFEDMSVRSPVAFRKGDAMRQLRSASAARASAFREALKELDQTARAARSWRAPRRRRWVLRRPTRPHQEQRRTASAIELVEAGSCCARRCASAPARAAAAARSTSASRRAAEIKLLKDRNDAEAKEVAKSQEVGQSAVALQQMRDVGDARAS